MAEVPVRSVRIPPELWARAQARAAREGVTMSQVLYAFTRAWADGRLDRPTVTVTYHPARDHLFTPATPDTTTCGHCGRRHA